MERMRCGSILCQWYDKYAFEKLEKLLWEEKDMSMTGLQCNIFIDSFEKRQAECRMRKDIDSEMIMAMFGTRINTGMQKEEIALKCFHGIQELMTEFILAEFECGKGTHGMPLRLKDG